MIPQNIDVLIKIWGVVKRNKFCDIGQRGPPCTLPLFSSVAALSSDFPTAANEQKQMSKYIISWNFTDAVAPTPPYRQPD